MIACLFTLLLQGQSKIILEELRCGSAANATMAYWKYPDVRKTFISQLNALLLKHWHLPLADTALPILDLNERDPGKPIPRVTYPDTTDLHLYLEVLENTPAAYFQSPPRTAEDSAVIRNTRTIFLLRVILEKSGKNVIYSNSMDILVSPGTTPGMGIESMIVSLMPKGLTELLRSSLDILLKPENDISQIQVKVAPAFIADNFILLRTLQQPRVFVTVKKDISTYRYQNKIEMIRMGETAYEEIKLKGKKAGALPPVILDAIRNTENYTISDYVYLKEDCRDVTDDRNYVLKMIVQLDPGRPPGSIQYAFTNFIPGNQHVFLHEKDTVAIFSVKTRTLNPTRQLYANKVWNGYDSSFIQVLAKETILPVFDDYLVAGKINNRRFAIHCGGYGNTLKEIYVDDKIVCIAQGRFNPEKFVVLDQTLSPELLKQLLMIGFNRFFE